MHFRVWDELIDLAKDNFFLMKILACKLIAYIAARVAAKVGCIADEYAGIAQ